jgi:cytoskeletal protein CcmA (bactofilin family)
MKYLVRRRWNLVVVGLLLLLTALVFSPVWAAEFREGDDIVVGTDEVIEDDLYVAAGTVTINGTIKGDLFALGGLVEINGVIEGDIHAAGQAIKINGIVEDDARVAGQVLYLGEEAVVSSDLLAAGFSLETKPGSSVGQDLLFVGYQVLLAGDVGRNVRFAGAAAELAGKVGGDVHAEVGEPGEGPDPTTFMFMPELPGGLSTPDVKLGLTLADTAQIEGELTYVSKAEGDIATGAEVTGGMTREEPAEPVEAERAKPSPVMRVLSWSMRQVQRFLTLLLVGLLIVWAAPGLVRQFGGIVQERPLPSLGWGVVALLVFVAALIALAVVTILLALILGLITLGGLLGDIIGLGALIGGIMVTVFTLIWSYLAKIIIVVLVGRLVLEKIKPDWSEGRVWPLVVGLILFVIVTAIPCLGAIVSLLVTLVGLGALWLEGQSRLRRPPAEAVAAPAA